MEVYAVIDTNVLVSALLAKHPDSAPVQILDRLFSRDFIPMYTKRFLPSIVKSFIVRSSNFLRMQSYIRLMLSLKRV